jgi:hypothetical protein
MYDAAMEILMTDSVEHSPSLEADNHADAQEIPRIL